METRTEPSVPRPADPFGRLLHLFDRLLLPLEWTLTFLGGLLIFALMIWGMVQITLRTLGRIKEIDLWVVRFNVDFGVGPIFGYIDYVVFFMVGFCMLAISYVQRAGGHVRMELLIGRLKGRAYWLMEMFGAAAALFIVIVLIPYSYDHFDRAFEMGDSTIDIELPTWPGKLAVPVALGILATRFTIQLLGCLRMVLRPGLQPVAVPHIKSVEELAADEIESARQ